MAPSVEMVRLQRQALADAAAAGQLGTGADSDEALWVISVLVSGVIGQAMANEPGLPWGEGRFERAAPETSRHTSRPLPPEARPPSVVRPWRQRGRYRRRPERRSRRHRPRPRVHVPGNPRSWAARTVAEWMGQ